MTESSQAHAELLALTADIVSSHFANNTVAVADVPNIIQNVYATLAGLGSPVEAVVARQEPAVSIRSSIKPDYIVCLEDGKKLKMLKRHLMTRYGMTPDDYRTKWGLPADYPMVAPNYAEQRRTLAKSIGLGTKRVAKVGGKPRGRPRKNPA
jgi:predicted transcriptional regulator